MGTLIAPHFGHFFPPWAAALATLSANDCCFAIDLLLLLNRLID
jgi:hypothetical protein